MNPAPDQGIFIVDKPVGMTSAGVVARMRRMLGMKRVGHTGTLDPFATGVLPICFGRATGAAHFMLAWPKRYVVDVSLGEATDTMDREGEVIERVGDPSAECKRWMSDRGGADIEDAVRRLIGSQAQRAPMYSAVKVDGRPLYRYARAGETVERPVRTVEVYEARICDRRVGKDGWPVVTLDFFVSSGTYIRVLADRLGRMLGTYGHAIALCRRSTGPFHIDDACALDDIARRFDDLGRDPVAFRRVMVERGGVRPTADAFRGWPAVTVDRDRALALAHGRTISVAPEDVVLPSSSAVRLGPPPSEDAAVFLDDAGRLIAVGRTADGTGRVRRVFIAPEEVR